MGAAGRRMFTICHPKVTSPPTPLPVASDVGQPEGRALTLTVAVAPCAGFLLGRLHLDRTACEQRRPRVARSSAAVQSSGTTGERGLGHRGPVRSLRRIHHGSWHLTRTVPQIQKEPETSRASRMQKHDWRFWVAKQHDFFFNYCLHNDATFRGYKTF